MSKVLDAVCDPAFSYARPWFYNHPLALRCELGQGEGRAYLKNARRRALGLYSILFPKGPDVFFFHHYIQDHDEDDPVTKQDIRRTIRDQAESLRFALRAQQKFRHKIIRDLPPDHFDEDDSSIARRNRIVCWPDAGCDPRRRIRRQIQTWSDPTIHFVSEENECIFSIYDDRGCDIVFFTPEKFLEFYPKLRPWFLEYDLYEMERRRKSCT